MDMWKADLFNGMTESSPSTSSAELGSQFGCSHAEIKSERHDGFVLQSHKRVPKKVFFFPTNNLRSELEALAQCRHFLHIN